MKDASLPYPPSPRRPLLSIVTIMRDARAGFVRTGESVVPAMPPWCEWVVIDGGSTDGTLEEVPRFRSAMGSFVSEPDAGIADAFNKGISRSRGEYILFLNAGDALLADFYEVAGALLARRAHPPAIVGQIRMNGRTFGRRIGFPRQWGRNHLPHQAMLVRRALFRLLGGYDTSYGLGMDYEWSLRLKSRWKDIEFISMPFSEMEPGGTSMTNYRKTFSSYHRARMKHCRHGALSKLLELFFVCKMRSGSTLRRLL